MNRRDAMKITALAGVTAGTCLSMEMAPRERPTEFAVAQIWERPDGVRGVVQLRDSRYDHQPDYFWLEWVTQSGSRQEDQNNIYKWWMIDEIDPTWSYCGSIFDRDGG